MDEEEQEKDLEPARIHVWKGGTLVEPRLFPVFTQTHVVKLSLGTGHCAFLTRDHQLFTLGANQHGQLGLGHLHDCLSQPQYVHTFSEWPVVDAGCGDSHSAAVTADGCVYCWGNSSLGQCGTGVKEEYVLPQKVHFNTNHGNHGDLSPLSQPGEVLRKPWFRQVVCGKDHTVSVTCDGELWVWGLGMHLGMTGPEKCMTPQRVDFLEGKHVLQACCGEKHTAVLVCKSRDGNKSTLNGHLDISQSDLSVLSHESNRSLIGLSGSNSNLSQSSLSISSGNSFQLKKDGDNSTIAETASISSLSKCQKCSEERYSFTENGDTCIITDHHRCTVSHDQNMVLTDPLSSQIPVSIATPPQPPLSTAQKETSEHPEISVTMETVIEKEDILDSPETEKQEGGTPHALMESPAMLSDIDRGTPVEDEKMDRLSETDSLCVNTEKISIELESLRNPSEGSQSQITENGCSHGASTKVVSGGRCIVCDSPENNQRGCQCLQICANVRNKPSQEGHSVKDEQTDQESHGTGSKSVKGSSSQSAASSEQYADSKDVVLELVSVEHTVSHTEETTPEKETVYIEGTVKYEEQLTGSANSNAGNVDTRTSVDSVNDMTRNSESDRQNIQLPLEQNDSTSAVSSPTSPSRKSKLSVIIDENEAREYLERHLSTELVTPPVKDGRTKNLAENDDAGSPQSPLVKKMESLFQYVPTSPAAVQEYMSSLTSKMVSNLRTTVDKLTLTTAASEVELASLSDASPTSLASSASVDDVRKCNTDNNIQRSRSMALGHNRLKAHSRNASLPSFKKPVREHVTVTALSDPVLDTEVWTWGSGQLGQLGHGDTLDRLHPCCISSLTGKKVVKVVAGANHVAALTGDLKVFVWGDNSEGQLGVTGCCAVAPQPVTLPMTIHPFDLSAGSHHTVILGDGGQPQVFFSGKASGDSPSKTDIPHVSYFTKTVFSKKINFVQQVFGGGPFSGAICGPPGTSVISACHQFVMEERAFFLQLQRISDKILQPFKNTDMYRKLETNQKEGPALIVLMDAFTHLTGKVLVNVWQLTQVVQGKVQLEQIQLIAQLDRYIAAFQHFVRSFCNTLAIGGFQYCGKTAGAFFSKHASEIEIILQEGKYDKKNPGANLQRLFQIPLHRIKDYCSHLSTLLSLASEESTLHASLRKAYQVWDSLKNKASKEHGNAEASKQFWASCPTKFAASLCIPSRRMLRDSRTYPLSLPNAGRFSVHWFLLFNDVFVHGHNSMHQSFPLSTIWVETVPSTDKLKNAIKLMMPEETLILTTPDTQSKADWLWALQDAIYKAVTSQRQKGAGVIHLGNTRLTPPKTRHGIHIFYKPGPHKDAKYTGAWHNGVMHGQGVLEWNDGKKYEGHFKENMMHGPGTMMIPSGDQQEIQTGNWKEGLLHGFATVKYSSGDTYEGHFVQGKRFGHGLMRQGRFLSSIASIYLGEWRDDRRCGYGVLDDIQRGQKYMGMWQDGNRHGNGIIVTLDGMYFEGNFVMDRITGVGLILTEDDTCYEGEFAGGPVLQGKGRMTMPNGDYIDGTFSGSFAAGVKVQGMFHKAADSDSVSSGNYINGSLGKFAVPAHQKWNEIFDQCYSQLGCHDGQVVHPGKAWEMVSVIMATGKKQQEEQQKLQGSRHRHSNTDELERIPPWNQGMLTLDSYRQIKRYLVKAFDTPYHPLGTLIDTLTNVYRATYVGVGAHPRLLYHAVEEIKSYVHRVYKVVRMLFPDLPPGHHKVELFDEVAGTSQDLEEDCEVVTPGELLHPLLLPRLYPPLFMLYALYNEKEDDAYWRRLVQWNKQSDIGLMTYLGLDEKFWLLDVPASTEETGHPRLPSIKDRAYTEAVETLQQISTSFSPADKLWLIQKTFNEVNKKLASFEVQPFFRHFFQEKRKRVQSRLQTDHLWCMDDLFPVFQYVVVRARIRHLGAEIHFIEDLMEKHLEHGELGLMFTTVKACFFQIQNEKPNI